MKASDLKILRNMSSWFLFPLYITSRFIILTVNISLLQHSSKRLEFLGKFFDLIAILVLLIFLSVVLLSFRSHLDFHCVLLDIRIIFENLQRSSTILVHLEAIEDIFDLMVDHGQTAIELRADLTLGLHLICKSPSPLMLFLSTI